MADERDLSELLPEAPPPRPARRDAAIDAAMARFDGAEPAAEPAPRPRRRAWFARPQLGAAMAMGLVAAIAVPLWMSGDPRVVPPPRQAAPQAADAMNVEDAPDAFADDAAASNMTALEEVPAPAPMPSAEPAPPPALPGVAAEAPLHDELRAMRQEQTADAEAQPRAQGYAVPAAPPPPPAMAAPAGRANRMATADAASSEGIVVTGARSAAPRRAEAEPSRRRPLAKASAARGDWNACTVNDPNPDPGACKPLVDPAAPGAAGRAAARTADGLTRAWAGDMGGAIAAFDQAIGQSRSSSFAYLNRGLAYERRGDTAKALADLDRAVRYAPQSARAYYQRSLLHARRGDTARAAADAERAVKLDPRYRAVVE